MTIDKSFKEEVISRNRKAQLELYSMCFDQLMGVARRYKNNEEDRLTLVNNAFIKIVSNLHNYEDQNFAAWIKRIIMNVVIDEFRKEKKYKEVFNFEQPIDNFEQSAYADIEYTHSAEALLAMVNKLPNATKNVFNLFAIDGYSHKEISENLDISLETSKWHMKEARKKLKEMLKVELIHEVA